MTASSTIVRMGPHRPRRDPYRCERCLVFWAPENAASNLWTHRGFLVCADRISCTARVAFTASFDRMIRQAASAPQEPTTARPVVTLHSGPGRPGEDV